MKSTKYLFLLFSLIIISCTQQIKEFKINSDVEHLNLTLYSDSTFNAKSIELEGTYYYQGTWNGNTSEDSIFTITYQNRFIIKDSNKRPDSETYKVKNNKPIEIKPK